MKKLLIILLFIPLVGFGQNKYSVYAPIDTSKKTTTTADVLAETSKTLSKISQEMAEKREIEAKRLGYSSGTAYAAELRSRRLQFKRDKKEARAKRKSNSKRNKKKEKKLETENKKAIEFVQKLYSQIKEKKWILARPQARALLNEMLTKKEITKSQFEKYISLL